MREPMGAIIVGFTATILWNIDEPGETMTIEPAYSWRLAHP